MKCGARLVALAFGLVPSVVHAQDVWPSRPITFVVPYAAGGYTDLVGRLAARYVQKALDRSVLIDNRTGAGGIVANFVPGADRTDSVLETSAGDITVYLAPTLNITIRASIELANGHRIHSDFSEIRVTTEGGQWGPGIATAEGNLNGGGPTLKVRTTTGDISFLASR